MRAANEQGLRGSVARLKAAQRGLCDMVTELVSEMKELRVEVLALRDTSRDNGAAIDEVLRILRDSE